MTVVDRPAGRSIRADAADLGELLDGSPLPAAGSVRVVTLAAEELDPIALFAAAREHDLEAALWLQPAAGFALVGIGRAWAVEAEGHGRFEAAAAAWRALLAATTFGGRALEPGALPRGVGPGAPRRSRLRWRGAARRRCVGAVRRRVARAARAGLRPDARRVAHHRCPRDGRRCLAPRAASRGAGTRLPRAPGTLGAGARGGRRPAGRRPAGDRRGAARPRHVGPPRRPLRRRSRPRPPRQGRPRPARRPSVAARARPRQRPATPGGGRPREHDLRLRPGGRHVPRRDPGAARAHGRSRLPHGRHRRARRPAGPRRCRGRRAGRGPPRRATRSARSTPSSSRCSGMPWRRSSSGSRSRPSRPSFALRDVQHLVTPVGGRSATRRGSSP